MCHGFMFSPHLSKSALGNTVGDCVTRGETKQKRFKWVVGLARGVLTHKPVLKRYRSDELPVPRAETLRIRICRYVSSITADLYAIMHAATVSLMGSIVTALIYVPSASMAGHFSFDASQ